MQGIVHSDATISLPLHTPVDDEFNEPGVEQWLYQAAVLLAGDERADYPWEISFYDDLRARAGRDIVYIHDFCRLCGGECRFPGDAFGTPGALLVIVCLRRYRVVYVECHFLSSRGGDGHSASLPVLNYVKRDVAGYRVRPGYYLLIAIGGRATNLSGVDS